MSHFTVLVIGDDVEGQLEPYDENLEVEPYWVVEYDPTAERAHEAFEATVTREWMDERAVTSAPGATSAKLAETFAPTAEQVLAAWTAKGYLEGRPYKVEGGKLWRESTHNQQSKWDWYEVGGRWTGFWKLTAEAAELVRDAQTFPLLSEPPDPTLPFVGRPGVMTDRAKPGYADSALKRHIDFVGMRAEKEAEALAEWAAYLGVAADTVARHGIGESWPQVFERVTGKAIGAPGRVDGELVDRARGEYHRQPYALALRQHRELGWIDDPHGHFGPDLGDASRNAFVKRAGDCAYSPFAVLRNGEWHGKGDMGWFGMASNEKSQGEWNSLIVALIEALPAGERLTIVDAHI